jgi:hypothetical protein
MKTELLSVAACPEPAARRTSLVISLLLAILFGTPNPASAQSDTWEVDVAPLYLWASEMDGRIVARGQTVPLFLPFDEAADSLAGAFSFHGEARKGKWGMLADLNFIRLSTDATFTSPAAPRVQLEGTAQLDMTMFEVGGTYLIEPESNISVLGGLRTYTLSPNIELTGPLQGEREFDASRTAASVFGGVAFRPKLTEKLALMTRADIGAGSAFTWSGTIGLAYRFRPWGGLAFGYHALGVDTGDADDVLVYPTTGDDQRVKYDVTHYGPFFSVTLHWAQK